MSLDEVKSQLKKFCDEGEISQVQEIFANYPQLLNAGLDILGFTPLHVAVMSAQSEMVEYLLSLKEVDVNRTNGFHWTALYSSCGGFSSVKIVKILLRARPEINVNKPCNEGNTPLHNACWSGNVPIVELLLLHPKVDIYATDKDEKYCWEKCCEWSGADKSKVKAIQDLIEDAKIREKLTPEQFLCYLKPRVYSEVKYEQDDVTNDGLECQEEKPILTRKRLQNEVANEKKRSKMEAEEFDVFLSHDWGKNGVNHQKVKELAGLFRDGGLKCWFDEESNRGEMKNCIAQGIYRSRVFIVFLTENYNNKVEKGETEGDWCYSELNYASDPSIFPPEKLILVVMEKEMKEKKNWVPRIQMEFANKPVFDLSNEDRCMWENNFQGLVTEVRRLVPRT